MRAPPNSAAAAHRTAAALDHNGRVAPPVVRGNDHVEQVVQQRGLVGLALLRRTSAVVVGHAKARSMPLDVASGHGAEGRAGHDVERGSAGAGHHRDGGRRGSGRKSMGWWRSVVYLKSAHDGSTASK